MVRLAGSLRRAGGCVALSRAAACQLSGRSTVAVAVAVGLSRQSSSTARRPRISANRRAMFDWLTTFGPEFNGEPNGPNHLGPLRNQPFPLNPFFLSENVLDEPAREQIWSRVIQKKESLISVSAALGVDIIRVAAVVRMKEVEKRWLSEGKKLARAYATTVMAMLPKTSYRGLDKPDSPHEPISSLHAHRLTAPQIFVPAAESRQFTRKDAAVAFNQHLLPADSRTPHPELVQLERDLLAGRNKDEGLAAFRIRAKASENALVDTQRQQREREDAKIIRVQTSRFEFRFRDVCVDAIGYKGRSARGVGWRYGAPFLDRQKGRVKIPTQIPPLPRA